MENKFLDLNEKELMETDGGGALLIGGAIVGCIALFAIGVYNGYKDTVDRKK